MPIKNKIYWPSSWLGRAVVLFLAFILLLAITADFLANPDNGALTQYGPNTIGTEHNVFKGPGFMDEYKGISRSHPLGTDGRGRDVAAILIHGSRTSLLLGFFASLIALFFGSFLGILSGYYGNRQLKMHPASLILFLVLGMFIAFMAYDLSYTFIDLKPQFSYIKFLSFTAIGLLGLAWSITKIASAWSLKMFFPMDNIVMRFTEIFKAVPKLFLLLSIITFAKSQNIWTTTFLIGSLGWPSILRLVRGEVLAIKKQTYLVNSKLMGQNDINIIIKHILPNVLPIVLVAMVFQISGNILLESTLSFLGLGLPPDIPSWGGLLKQSREDFSAWWLAIFPGLTITLTLFSLNIIAEMYNNSTKKSI